MSSFNDFQTINVTLASIWSKNFPPKIISLIYCSDNDFNAVIWNGIKSNAKCVIKLVIFTQEKF